MGVNPLRITEIIRHSGRYWN